jgi:lipopolysaccharide transport system permease protein
MRNFGKVYFQIIVPISIVISNLLKFGIQFCIAFLFIYYFQGRHKFKCHKCFISVLNCSDGDFGTGIGNVYFLLVTKYRDFSYLIGFGVITHVCFSRGLPYGIG